GSVWSGARGPIRRGGRANRSPARLAVAKQGWSASDARSGLGGGRGLSGGGLVSGGCHLGASPLDDVTHGVRWLGANAQPVLDAVGLKGDGGGVGNGVVGAHNLNEATVTRRAAISRHNPVAWSFLGSHSPQPKLNHAFCSLFSKI